MSWNVASADLVWHGSYPADAADLVRADLCANCRQLKRASDLVFHHVFLTDDIEDGPFVVVHGEEGDTALHCTYVEEAAWETFTEVPFQ